MKRYVAALLAVLMLVSAWGDTTAVSRVRAQEAYSQPTDTVEQSTDTNADTDTDTNTDTNTDTDMSTDTNTNTNTDANSDANSDMNTDTSTDTNTDTDTNTTADTNQESADITKNTTDATTTDASAQKEETSAVNAKDDLKYVIETASRVTKGSNQQIVVGMDQEKAVHVTKAQVVIRNLGTGNIAVYSMTDITEDGLYFSYQAKHNGTYEVVGVVYSTDQNTSEYIVLSELSMSVKYGVNCDVTTNPDGYIAESDAADTITKVGADSETGDIVTTDDNGNTTGDVTLEDAINDSMSSLGAKATVTKVGGSTTQSVIIVLDPGHGGYDGGASANGVQEKDLNLKIAKYAKAELEKYVGATVYLTRSDDTYLSLDQRAQIAGNLHANLFVSIHNNSATATATGAEVFYPNSNGTNGAAIGSAGQGVAQQIENQLVALGLANRGIAIRNSESGDSYADGSLMDYYGVIRRCKNWYGIPGIIVEHAFVSNASDVANYLNSDSKLKKLGVADATGIAKYYGLSKTLPTPGNVAAKMNGFNGIKVTWNKVSQATKYTIYRRRAGDSSYKKIGTSKSTSYTDRTGYCSAKYYYRVTANANSYGSAMSKSANATTSDGLVTIKSVKASGFNDVIIKWGKRGNASGYRIYRKTEGGKWQKVIDVSGSVSSYTDGGLACGTKYYYSVRAFRTNGSKKIMGKHNTTGTSVVTNTSTAQLNKVTTGSFNEVNIQYAKVTGASGYRIYRKTTKGSWQKVGDVNSSTLSFTDKTGNCNTRYEYRVRAYRRYLYSMEFGSYSSSKAVTTRQCIPKITSVTNPVFNITVIQFSGISKASGYRIYRKVKGSSVWTKIGETNGSNRNYVDQTAQCDTTYYYSVRAYRVINNKKYMGNMNQDGSKITTSARKPSYKSTTVQQKCVKVKWRAVDGATSYRIYRKTWGSNTWQRVGSTGNTSFQDYSISSGYTYCYRVKACRQYMYETFLSNASNSGEWVTTLYSILGSTNTTVQKMVDYYNSQGKSYPSYAYASKGAATINDFCQILYDESVANGVNAEVVFAQMCIETGFLQYGGDVSVDQCNFAGMGATGGGVAGNTFYDVRAGLVGQIRHLKLYASSSLSDIPNDGTDPRYNATLLGKAPYVEWLSIPNNPYGVGWAADGTYAPKLLNIIWKIHN